MHNPSVEQLGAAHSSKRQFRPYNIIVILTMCFASLSLGYCLNIISSTLAQPSFIAYFHLDTRPDATSILSTTNGVFQAGAFFGACSISYVGDHLGRKWGIAIPLVLVVISGAGLAGSVSMAMFIVFRFIAGCGGFWLLGAVPVWMTEIVPPRNRGLLVDLHSASLLLGYTWASWMGYAWFHLKTDNNSTFRGPLALQCLAPLVPLIAMRWLPESPRYLIQRGRHEEARVILHKLHEPEEAAIEFAQIDAQVNLDKSLPSSWLSLLTKKSYRKRTFFAIGLACGIQFTGVLVITNYSSIIYNSLGVTGSQVLLYQSGYNTLGWGSGLLAIFIIDRVPRNKLVAIGTFFTTSCLVVEAALVANFKTGPNQNDSALKAAVAMNFCYITFAELLLDGTQYVYFAELFPSHLRNKGMTIGMAAISLMNVMWLQAAPTAFANIGWKFYLAFIIPAYLFAIVAWFFYPNTKGLALEEIAAIFGDEVRTDVAFEANESQDSQSVQTTTREKERELTATAAYAEHKT